jgi:hypothetical protein
VVHLAGLPAVGCEVSIDLDKLDDPIITVGIIDTAAQARLLYGDNADYIAGRKLPEHEYRLNATTPTGGTVTFHSGATAEDVAAYWQREGWLTTDG